MMTLKLLPLVLILSCSLSAFGATTRIMQIKGKVALKLSLSIEAKALASTLPLDQTQTDSLVAEIRKKSNSRTGHKVRIISSNRGRLKRATGTEYFPFTMKYDGIPVDLSTSSVRNYASPTVTNTVRPLTITYQGQAPETMKAGEYVDEIRFTISAN